MPKIRILHSDTPGNTPTAALLVDRGRIAINHADGKLFWIDADGVTVRSFNFLNPTVPDQVAADNTTKAANTKFVQAALTTLLALIDGSNLVPALSDFTKIARALNNDANFATTITAAVNNRVRYDAVMALTTAQKAQVATNLGLGTAANSAATAFATAAQGTKADNAAQRTELDAVAFTGHYSDLDGQPTIPFSLSYASPAQAVTLASAVTLNHGLGGIPLLAQMLLTCVTAEAGYAVGDVIIDGAGGEQNNQTSGYRGYSLSVNATQATLSFGGAMSVLNKAGGPSVSITPARWTASVRAWR